MTRHLLVIGGQRCGSTYLAGLLDAHPDITMARPARPEPKVFLSDEKSARGLSWYRRTYFRHATTEQLLGEKSTSYIEDPLAPGRAASVLGAADIVAVLRDPIARAVSNWRFSTDNGLEQRPLAVALSENLVGGATWEPGRTSVSPYAYLERGRYARYLAPWAETFPESMHVVFLSELQAEPAALAGLYAALGVDPDFKPAGFGAPANESRHPAEELPENLLEELDQYFGDSDEELARMIGRGLPWRTARSRGGSHD